MSVTSRLLRRANLRFLSGIIHTQVSVGTRELNLSGISIETTSKLVVCARHFCTSSSVASPINCWRCGESERESGFFCKTCNALQKPDDQYNFFQLLGVHQSFDIKSQELSKKFRQLQALLHPDKFSNATEDEKIFSADLSSLVNKAFRTLSDPLERGLYLLSLEGMHISEDNTSLNKSFLLEIMELNEELESISSVDQLTSFHSRNKETLTTIVQRVTTAFADHDVNTAKSALMEMKYFTTLESKIKEKMLLLGAL